MTFRSRIGCMVLAAAVSSAGWAQDKPAPQAAPDAQAASQQNKKPGDNAITVTPISTNVAAQADATRLDAKFNVVAPHVALSTQPLSNLSHMLLLRGLQAEFVFLRRTFPFSERGLTLKANTNVITPEGVELQTDIATHGAAAKPGDRGQITDVVVKDKTIVFELNGGPKKKTKWYQRIQVGGASGSTPIAPAPDNSMAHGSYLFLEFDKFVPEMTVEQAKQLLTPVFDFSSISATVAYADIMPPKVKQALKEHKALVGMNHEMVINAKGRPGQKVRERDAGSEYEEWIYGAPPQTVEFVRFIGDEVVQIKDMTMDGQRLVRTEREVDFPPGQVPGTPSAVIAQSAEGQGPPGSGDQQPTSSSTPAKKPSLRRAGEPDPDPGQAPLPSESKCRPRQNPQPGSDPNNVPVCVPMPPPTQQPGPVPGQMPTPGQGPPQ